MYKKPNCVEDFKSNNHNTTDTTIEECIGDHKASRPWSILNWFPSFIVFYKYIAHKRFITHSKMMCKVSIDAGQHHSYTSIKNNYWKHTQTTSNSKNTMLPWNIMHNSNGHNLLHTPSNCSFLFQWKHESLFYLLHKFVSKTYASKYLEIEEIWTALNVFQLSSSLTTYNKLALNQRKVKETVRVS